MRLLLDTSVLIAADPPPSGDEVAVAAVSFAELAWGVSAATDPTQRTLRAVRLNRLRDELGPGIPFDDAAAEAFGHLTALVLATGRDPRSRALDLMIAATARTHGAGVFTRNPDDFIGVEPLVPIRAAGSSRSS